jgi:dGTP triphosphohydrolase
MGRSFFPRSYVVRLLTSLALVLPSLAAAGQPIQLTQDEFKMFRHWQKAMSDPQVEKFKPEARTAAIARDAGYKLSDLQKAIAKGEQSGDLRAACESNVKEALAAGTLGGRVQKIEVDLDQPHAVAYVGWRNEDLSQLEEEAAVAASLTSKACPIVSSIQVWAEDKTNADARVFQALISRNAAARIDAERAKDFAHTRYIRLFQRVKSAARGDVIAPESAQSAPSGAGSGGSGRP